MFVIHMLQNYDFLAMDTFCYHVILTCDNLTINSCKWLVCLKSNTNIFLLKVYLLYLIFKYNYVNN